jgi:hypothetical protein
MNNLLTNEVEMLNTHTSLKTGLQIEPLTDLQQIIDQSNSTKFDTSVKMSKLVLKSFKYFKSDVCKNILEEEGISWGVEEYSQKVFGWNKSFFYKMVKLGNTPTRHINKFNREVDRMKQEGTPVVRSVENCLKFVKELNTEGSGEEQTTMTPRTETTLSIKYKCETMDNTFTFKIVNGEVKTDMSSGQIETLIGKLNEFNNN